MDIYDTIEFDENYAKETLKKTEETSGETYDDAISTYPKEDTSEVSKYAKETLSETYDDALSTYPKGGTSKVSKCVKETLSETYDDALSTYPKGGTSKVSKCVKETLSETYDDAISTYPKGGTSKVSKCAKETLSETYDDALSTYAKGGTSKVSKCAKETLSETYDDILTTYPKEDTSEVSTCACVTTNRCLLLFAMMGVFLSLASLGIAIREKVEAVDGSWSAWESWEACSVTCDVGMQTRQRNCSNPAPLGNGRQCLGVDTEHKLCFPGPCSSTLEAVDGSCSTWESWEVCSVTCDAGVQTRQRTCSHSAPLGNERQCLGVDIDDKVCFPGPCSMEAVDGSWSAWESWEACSVTCDVGVQTRQRNCSNPAPLGNGRQCLGVDIDHKLCFPGACSNGGWSRWGFWGRCSASCNGGVRSRFRKCTDPVPSLAGRHCEGNQAETVSCNNINCDKDCDFIDFLASIKK